MRMAILFAVSLSFSSFAIASTFVNGRKYFLVSTATGYVKTAAEAAAARAKELCVGGVVNCSGTYTTEYFDDGYNMWRWKGIWTYQTVYNNPPNAPVYNTYEGVIAGAIVFECPSGFTVYSNKAMPGVCVAPDVPVPPPHDLDSDSCNCSNPYAGNPIEIGTAVKQQIETDYQDPSGSLSFKRIYRSDTNRWEFSYQISVGNIQEVASPYADLGANCFNGLGSIGGAHCYPYLSLSADRGFLLRRPGGVPLYFNASNAFKPAADVNDRVSVWIENGENVGWVVVNGSSDAVEKYSLAGQLMEIRDKNGRTKTFVYSDIATPDTIAPGQGYLLSVTDSFGRILKFTYAWNGLLSTMTDPNGQVYIYTFGTNKTLSSVTYPDGKFKEYFYNEPENIKSGRSMPFALTGIKDENGSRFATFRYNVDGTAISTEHALGVNKYEITYASSNTYNKVTDPLGTIRTYTFRTPLTFRKASEIAQPTADGASTVSSSMAYDANGNLASITDFNGNVTKYTYDLTRNLPLTKVSAFGTASATTTTTAWDPRWRLPAKVAEPKRITSYAYDDNGNVLSKSVQATTDTTGASGINAVTTGAAQVWTYTYNLLGQVLTAKGPRTDVDDTTVYTYDSQGNLTTETDALGHVTTYTNYDASGRVGRITDPNGLTTDSTYTPRGWLASSTTGDETTSYEYDGVGQVTRVTLPSGAQISYAYDAAHRLTQITDSLGNTITYTLDALGNRTSVLTNDSNGVLARKAMQIYNALGKLKNQTGGVQ